MRSAPSRTSVLALVAVLALALILRLAWLAHADTTLLPLSDPQYYHATAQNLAEGRGYSVTVDQRGFVAGPKSESTAFWAPGYPFALAPLYKLFGAKTGVARIFNAIASALTVLPVFYLGWRLGFAGKTARSWPGGVTAAEVLGLIAAALFAVAPSLVYWTASLFSEPLFTLGVACTLAVALWAGERRSLAGYFIAGVVLAATAFVRSQGMLMIVPVGVLLLAALRDRPLAVAGGSVETTGLWPRMGARDVLRVAVPLAAGVALLVVPWAIRNDIAMGSPYLINDSLGYNLRLAHAPYSRGTSVPPQDLWDERPGISFFEREKFFADVGTSRALTYAREHPGRELQLAVRRIGYLTRSDAEAAVRWSESLGATPIGSVGLWTLLGDLYYYPVVLLAACALFAAPRTRVWLALWSSIAVWGALHLVFAGEPRYHVPLMPVVVVLAAATIVRVVDLLRGDALAATGRPGRPE
jgi:hypothetical protein